MEIKESPWHYDRDFRGLHCGGGALNLGVPGPRHVLPLEASPSIAYALLIPLLQQRIPDSMNLRYGVLADTVSSIKDTSR